MTDREFLIWLHERLVKVHRERELVDYMHRLRGIIEGMPPDKETPHVASTNDMRDLLHNLEQHDKRRAEGWMKRGWRFFIEQSAARL
jgi:hypothetical protein